MTARDRTGRTQLFMQKGGRMRITIQIIWKTNLYNRLQISIVHRNHSSVFIELTSQSDLN